MSEELLVSNAGPLRILSMNRPERRNAMSPGMLKLMVDQARLAMEDESARAVLLRGEGGTFCVGGDVKAMAEGAHKDMSYEQRLMSLRSRMEVSRLLHIMPKPTVAAV